VRCFDDELRVLGALVRIIRTSFANLSDRKLLL
jgi:hypothetical protein